jgi:hypothetical protein
MHFVSNLDKYSTHRWKGTRKNDVKNRAADLLMGIKVSLGSRLVTSNSKTDIKWQLLASLREKDEIEQNRVSLFQTDLGARFGFNQNNIKVSTSANQQLFSDIEKTELHLF